MFAGVLLLVIGLGIAYGVYTWAGSGTTSLLSFSVSLTPPSATVSRDNSRIVDVSIMRYGTYDKAVTLTAAGVPANVTVSFSPSSGMPTFGSTMTINVGSTATLGTTTITVKATGADQVEQTATFSLTVA